MVFAEGRVYNSLTLKLLIRISEPIRISGVQIAGSSQGARNHDENSCPKRLFMGARDWPGHAAQANEIPDARQAFRPADRDFEQESRLGTTPEQTRIEIPDSFGLGGRPPVFGPAFSSILQGAGFYCRDSGLKP